MCLPKSRARPDAFPSPKSSTTEQKRRITRQKRRLPCTLCKLKECEVQVGVSFFSPTTHWQIIACSPRLPTFTTPCIFPSTHQKFEIVSARWLPHALKCEDSIRLQWGETGPGVRHSAGTSIWLSRFPLYRYHVAYQGRCPILRATSDIRT